MKRLVFVGSSLVLAFAFAGCPGSGPADNANGTANDNSTADANANVNASINENSSGEPYELLPGVWHRTSAEAMADWGDAQLDYMILNEDYTIEMYFRHPEIGFRGCHYGLFMPTRGLLFLAVDTLFTGTMMAQYEMLDANTLSVSEPGREPMVFDYVDALPDEYQCEDLSVLNTFAGLPAPNSRSGLAYDGTQLWYTLDEFPYELQPVDPDTGATGATVDALTDPFVQACQGTDFWVLSGGGENAQLRRQDDTLIDEVDTRADLATPNTVTVMTYDPDGHVLWIHGQANALDFQRVLRVNSDAEPDELIDARPLDIEIQALAWHAGSLWALLDNEPYVVVELDPDSLIALHTYTAPLPDVRWRALAWVADSLYLIGSQAGEGVLVETRP